MDRVAADPAIGDTDPEPAYRDSVKHDLWREAAARHGVDNRYVESDREKAKWAEHVRQSRLRRWQEQR